jgi:hypothetical protein
MAVLWMGEADVLDVVFDLTLFGEAMQKHKLKGRVPDLVAVLIVVQAVFSMPRFSSRWLVISRKASVIQGTVEISASWGGLYGAASSAKVTADCSESTSVPWNGSMSLAISP